MRDRRRPRSRSRVLVHDRENFRRSRSHSRALRRPRARTRFWREPRSRSRFSRQPRLDSLGNREQRRWAAKCRDEGRVRTRTRDATGSRFWEEGQLRQSESRRPQLFPRRSRSESWEWFRSSRARGPRRNIRGRGGFLENVSQEDRSGRRQNSPSGKRRQQESRFLKNDRPYHGDGDRGRWQWRQRRYDETGIEAETIESSRQPNRHPAGSPAPSRFLRAAKHLAVQTQRHSQLRQKHSSQQTRPAVSDQNQGFDGRPLSVKLMPAPTQPTPGTDPSSKQMSSRGLKTYAEAVRQGPDQGMELREPRSRQSSQILKKLGQPVDPAREGRCFRCLGRGHAARECRDPITCRLCRQPGHRQASCPLRRLQRSNIAGPALADCLIGEVRGEEPLWEHILEAIRTVCPYLLCPDAHRLVSGTVFIRRMAKADWRKLLGATQQLPGGAYITWRRPHPSDGAFPSFGVTKRLEIRGVPFGSCKWLHLERMIRPVGTLRKIVCEGIQDGDPNCMCLDVEVDGDKEVPNKISTEVKEGRDFTILITELPPPPPPAATRPSSVGAATRGAQAC